MLEIVAYIFWVLLAITILVFVHELGHFLTAKLFGMRVERFAIGFPPIFARKRFGETEYALGATPLGGYVKISGMIDESLDTEGVSEEPKPYEYRSKPVWQRIVVITAGVIFNVLLAWAIYTGLKMAYGETYVPAENVESVYVEEGSVAHRMGLRTGDHVVAVSGKELERFDELGDIRALTSDSLTVTVERDGQLRTFVAPEDVLTQLTRASRQGGGFGVSFQPAIIGDVAEGAPAAQIGLKSGDRITEVNEERVRFWAELTEHVEASKGQPLTIQWERPDSLVEASDEGPTATLVRQTDSGARIYETRVTPDSTEGRYVLGVYAATPQMMEHEFGVRHASYGLGSAIRAGLNDTWSNTRGIAVSLQRVFTGRDSFRENVGGPVAIAQITKEAAEAGARPFWGIVALLSITLAIINILPIPALDGGHLMFLIYEGITRREPSARVRLALQQIGMVVLIAFMAFVIFNDILRL